MGISRNWAESLMVVVTENWVWPGARTAGMATQAAATHTTGPARQGAAG